MFLIFCVILSAGAVVIDLNGDWKISNKNKSIVVDGKVPGSVYSALEEKYLTDGPILFRFNDRKYRWISKEDWEYRVEFEVKENVTSSTRAQLLFYGIDTAAQIFLNGARIASTDNMFLRYAFDVRPLLQVGSNILQINFESPIKYSRRRYQVQLRSYLVPPACVVPEFNGECHANHIRKMQASFGWDWGPALPTMGIWKPAYLDLFTTARLRDVVTTTIQELDGWILQLDCHFDTATLAPLVGMISVELPQLGVSYRERVILHPNINRGALHTVKIFLDTERGVKMWWPAFYGSQTLYDLIVKFEAGGTRDKRRLRIGFRTVKLVEEAIEGVEGLSFYFRINGIPVFLKGSNWVPVDILPEKATKARVKHLLLSAVKANMNILRVWGGGIYESDYFYELADELGLMIWQDMMFACSMYPTNEEFLQSVEQEVRYQVRRLQNHPSVIVWAGNNENEAALRGNWYMTEANFSLYKADYTKLYVDTIRRTVLTEDQSRPFLVSSPTNGLQSEREGNVARNPYSELYGDVHFYNYYADAWNWTSYPKPRMASEYGFQSLPSFESIQEVSIPEDWDYDSDWLKSRQHHPLGKVELLFQITKRLGTPRNINKEQFFKDVIYLTQVHQAYALKVQTEHYRRCRNKTFDDSSGLTMGAMYWQLNDVWAAPSWSSIEANGRWKPLHYFARKFFSQILTTAFEYEENLLVDVVSDHLSTWSSLSLEVLFYSWDSLQPVLSQKLKFDAPGLSSVTIYDENPQLVLNSTICGTNWQRRCFVVTKLTDYRARSIGYSNFYLPESFPNVENLEKANITVSDISERRTNKNICFDLLLKTDTVAPFVHISTGKIYGQLSDNGFLMFQPEKSVRFCTFTEVEKDQLRDELKVTSLSDVIIH